MTINSTAPSDKKVFVSPRVFASYGHGWRQMWRYILELLLIAIVSLLLSIPSLGLSLDESGQSFGEYLTLDLIFVEISGPAAFFLISLTWLILFEWPLEYGMAFVHLKAARHQTLRVKNMFEVFKNYGNAIFANLLTSFIIMIGLVFLLIPGIYFGCKFAFVPYLIVDKKMDVIEAVKQSWNLTHGYTFTIFLMGVMAFFVGLLGLLVFGVGILISIIWIRLAFASLYYAVIIKNVEQSVKD